MVPQHRLRQIGPATSEPIVDRGLGARLKRTALLALVAVLSVNVWTGCPLAALWIGSRVQGDGPATMGAIAVVAASMGSIGLVLLRAISAASAAYDKLTGRRQVRRALPWLRSMRGERAPGAGDRGTVSALDVIVVLSVTVAVVAFEIWFFFFSTSPIDQRSGR